MTHSKASGCESFQRGSRVGTLSTSTGKSQDPPSIRKFIGDPMDRYLASIGLVKKMMPNDKGSSIYRAVCESLAMDQSEYLDLKEVVEEEMLMRYRLQRFRNGLPVVNKLEDTLETIARLLRIDIHVYRNVGEPPQTYRCSRHSKKRPEKVMLCETARGQFDLVYTLQDHKNLAYAQTMLYSMLYVHTFGFSPSVIKESIDRVRADMDSVGIDKSPTSSSSSFEPHFSFGTKDLDDKLYSNWRPPIPYSAVKALDPSVYRNIAYDLFSKDRRRELGKFEEFQPGAPCFFLEDASLKEAVVKGYIDKNSRLIAVDGKQRKVKISELVPHPQWTAHPPDPSSSPKRVRDRTKRSEAENTTAARFPIYEPAGAYYPVPFFEYNFWGSLYCQYGQYAVPPIPYPFILPQVGGIYPYGPWMSYVPVNQAQPRSAYDSSYWAYYSGFPSPPSQFSASGSGTSDGNNGSASNGNNNDNGSDGSNSGNDSEGNNNDDASDGNSNDIKNNNASDGNNNNFNAVYGIPIYFPCYYAGF